METFGVRSVGGVGKGAFLVVIIIDHVPPSDLMLLRVIACWKGKILVNQKGGSAATFSLDTAAHRSALFGESWFLRSGVLG
jgi:hypothetical protein